MQLLVGKSCFADFFSGKAKKSNRCSPKIKARQMTCGFCNEIYSLDEENLKEILNSLEN